MDDAPARTAARRSGADFAPTGSGTRPGAPAGNGSGHGADDETELESWAEAYLAAPDRHVRAQLVARLRRTEGRVTTAVEPALEALAADEEVNHQRLAPFVVARLRAAPAVAELLTKPSSASTHFGPALAASAAQALHEPLTVRLLSDYLLASEEVESLLGSLRRLWLEELSAHGTCQAPLDVLAAAGLQLQITEWVYDETSRERDQLTDLEHRLEKGIPDLIPALVYALYRPLAAPDDFGRQMGVGDRGPVAELLRRHLIEPETERAIGLRLPRLTQIDDPVSRAVRAQYEERPYPRWRRIPSRQAQRFADILAAAVGRPELTGLSGFERPRILIAGAGTGRHAVLTASRYEGAEVLAIDLSRASLAYGARQAQSLGVTNVAFAQADIAGLELSHGPFDVVECVGVLHHMADPEAGWAALRQLIRPGGLMKVGLYSRRGRTFIDPVVSEAAARGLGPDLTGIRAVRSKVRRLPTESPARRIASSPDFFSQSGCRDLFFHVHEDRFDLQRIARTLDSLGLEFLGFELPSPQVRDLYHRQFPGERTGRSLSNWDILEQHYPMMFSAMYRFWVRS